MNIGDVSAYSGLSAKTIRYYETRGLIRPLRDGNGYRAYRNGDAQKLRFLAQARKLGFSLRDCEGLLAFFEMDGPTNGEVANLFKTHMEGLSRQLSELGTKHETIKNLLDDRKPQQRADEDLIKFLTGAQPQEPNTV